jgi:hypothetical protein
MSLDRVFAFGDSFTYGHELSDCPTNDYPTPSNLSYGALVAKAASAEYHCHAMGSYANNAIARRILEALPVLNQHDMVLVMWTFTTRRELLLQGAGYRSLNPNGIMPLEKEYFKCIDVNPIYHINESLKEIYIAQQLLSKAEVPYIFMSSVTDLAQAVQQRAVPWSNYIDTDTWMFLNNCLGFNDWAKTTLGLKFGQRHPPDMAHQELAKRILDKIYE